MYDWKLLEQDHSRPAVSVHKVQIRTSEGRADPASARARSEGGGRRVDDIYNRNRYFVKNNQGVNLTEDGKKALMTLSLGDMRRVLNILQSCAMAFDTVSEVDKG